MAVLETELYEPIKAFLEAQGYTVQAEVKHCDIAARKEEQFVIVELKKAFNLKLVYQALERQSLTELVFVAIPRPQKGHRQKAWKDMLRLLKRLELGLLTVALDSPMKTVDVVLEPSDSIAWKNRKKREQVQKEMNGRNLNSNTGGMTRKKLMTAFREKSIRIACLLEAKGQTTTAEIRALGMEECMVPLSKNYDAWFERLQRGVYALSEKGKKALEQEEYKEAVTFYRKEMQEYKEEWT
ncbi:MAG: hypothetical protein IKA89_00560 [Anaerotignum sp.]|nr:hypothetical protein [Anaerotignum sp.]